MIINILLRRKEVILKIFGHNFLIGGDAYGEKQKKNNEICLNVHHADYA